MLIQNYYDISVRKHETVKIVDTGKTWCVD